MDKGKVWHRSKNISFNIGEKVVLFRRKANGYPRFLDDDKTYRIKRIDWESIFIIDVEFEGSNHEDSFAYGTRQKEFKVHRSFLVPLNINRGLLLAEFLKDI
jgi:hypothetical protein